MTQRTTSARWQAIPTIACVAGIASIGAIGLGRYVIAVACVGLTALAAMYLVAPRSIFFVGIIAALMPQLRAIPSSFDVLGRSIYFTDVLLPIGLVLALRATSVPRSRRIGFAATLYATSVAVGLMLGVLTRAPTAFVLRDIRGPVYVLVAYVGVLFLYRDDDARVVIWLASAVLWLAAALVVVESATGVGLLAGRVEAIDPTQAITDSGATRFLVAPVYLAMLVLCAGMALMLRSPRLRGTLRITVALAVPAFVIVFLSFSRRSLLALAAAAVFVAIFSPLPRLLVRTGALLVIALALYAAASAGPLAGNSYVATQAGAFYTRVVEGVSGTARAQDLGIIWRGREDAFATKAIRQEPVFGRGWGAQYRPSVHGEPFAAADREFGRTYAHNFYLWLSVKLGLFGLFAFALFVGSPIVAAAARSRRSTTSQRIATFALAAGVVGIVAINVVSPVFNEPATAVLLGSAVAFLRIRTDSGSERNDGERTSGTESVRPMERAARWSGTH